MKTTYIYLLFVLFITNYSAQPKSEIIGKIPGKLDITLFETGEEPDWTDYKGKVVLLDFWASWCTPCIQAIPHVNGLADKFRDEDVVFISLTYEPKELVEKFLLKYPMKTIVALDSDFQTFRNLNGWAIPNIFMVDKEGKIAGRIHPDYLTESVINDLLSGKIPDVEQTKEDLYDPEGAEEYFRKLNEKQIEKWVGNK